MARKTISLEQLDQFSVDEQTNQLYWRNKEVVTMISLPWWVNAAAIAVGLSAVATLIIEVGKVIVHGL